MKKFIELNSLKGIELSLCARKKVNNLTIGALENGGATLLNNGVYSNYDNGDNKIIINEKNTISIIIPSTIDADKEIDNTEYVNYYSRIIKNYAKFKNVFFYNSIGSWYSDNLNKVIIEKNTIITCELDANITVKDVQFMLNLGKIVKNDMSQESVSILINDALCLV